MVSNLTSRFGGLRRNGPTGGSAKGAPRKSSTSPFMEPTTVPAGIAIVVRVAVVVDNSDA